MSLLQVLLLGGCGLAGGIVAGLLGVGGGIVFAPVLFVTYRSLGADPGLVAPLTLGSSLLCTSPRPPRARSVITGPAQFGGGPV